MSRAAGIRRVEPEVALAKLRAVAGADTTHYLNATARAAAAGVTPDQIDMIARVLSTTATPVLLPQPTDRLPLLCHLRRHTWRRQPVRGGWVRDTCNRCRDLDLPTPTR